jgi:cytochrome P450
VIEDALDPSDTAFLEDPYPEYMARQGSCPVFALSGVGTGICGYENLIALSTDSVHFSRQIPGQLVRFGIGENPVGSEVRALAAGLVEEAPALFHADPPAHTVHRQLVNQAFAPRRVRLLEPHMKRLAHGLIDRFIETGQIEFFNAFAVPFPLGVLSGMLGVAPEDMGSLKRWTDDMLAGISEVVSDQRRLEVTRSAIEFQRHFLALIEARRREPCEDVLTGLIHARLEDGRQLHESELLPIIAQLAIAGHETSTNFLVNSLVRALRSPEQLASLRRERSLIPAFLEEALRNDPPLQCTFRRATEEIELDGVVISKDQTVAVFWAAGGYDPTVFEDPTAFRPGRKNARRHLAFGHGTHFCVGSELARLEGRIAFDALLDRLAEIELDEAASDLSRRPSFAHRAYRSVVVRFTPAAGPMSFLDQPSV